MVKSRRAAPRVADTAVYRDAGRIVRALWMVSALLLGAAPAFATSYTSGASGNWSSSATWGGAGVPGAGDTATITGGYTVTLDVAVIIANLSQQNGTLNGTMS